MTQFDDLSAEQIAMALEAKITHTIRTAKRTPNFKVYLDMLNATYIQATALSEMLKAASRLAMENNEL